MNTDRLLREVETRLARLGEADRQEVLDAVREEIARERRRVEPELTVEAERMSGEKSGAALGHAARVRLFARTPSPTMTPRALDVFFRPRTVALIGATEQPSSVGYSLLSNLRQGRFGGTVYAVNPRHESLLGLPCYSSIGAIPQAVDLAVIATPALTVPQVVRECAQAGVGGAIVISAGFREAGKQGLALEQEVLAEARKGKLRILGPNCEDLEG